MRKIFILILVTVFALGLFVGLKHKKPETYKMANAQVGSKTFMVEIADTPDKQKLGLSGRKSLPRDQGMLFIFDKPGRYGFWMKDMNFPIDIVWFDTDNKIIGVTKNLQPTSYPQVFYPDQEVGSVLEINTGLI